MNGLKLSFNALRVLEKRYLLKDDRRKVIETPLGLFRRVAKHVARAEDNFRDKKVSRKALEHLYIQAAFQKYTDNSVSKTVNLPARAEAEDIKKIYLLAHRLKCKGITVYRYGTKKEQVLSFPGAGRKAKPVVASSVYSGGTCASEVCA